MLKVRICSATGDVLAEGTCSDSGFFPPAVAHIYNAALKRGPVRTLQHCDTAFGAADYPEGTRRATFGYTQPGHAGGEQLLDDEVVLHVERV